MPPIASNLELWIQKVIQNGVVVIFSKTTCSFCKRTKKMFEDDEIFYNSIELNEIENGKEIQDILAKLTNQKTVPNIFVRGKHIGGFDDAQKAHSEGKIREIMQKVDNDYDYDLIVIGGGSGGLAAGKEAGRLGAKVAVLDFVQPTPMGTSWGLGGTCVNVGCIPKKLMHQAALLKHSIEDAKVFGWNIPNDLSHNWSSMVTEIQNHVKSLNWGYRVALRNKNVDYINAYAQFTDSHKIKTIDKSNRERVLTAKQFIVCTGERPRYPDVDGARELAITSDDLFSLPYCPGKTLVIGASYVALECAGFLASLGLSVTVMVRSIFLRGFDQQMANKVGEYMESHCGVKFVRNCVPIRVLPMEEGEPGKKEVVGQYTAAAGDKQQQEYREWFNTVLFAIGRDPCTSGFGLDTIGVELDKSSRVKVDSEERTNIPHVYAIGDIISGGLQLTPVAIQAGKNLARRLYAGSNTVTDYKFVPTTVFTPLEYSCIGYSEEDALNHFGGEENIEVFHQYFTPLEWTIPHRGDNLCYAKLICDKSQKLRIIGLHVFGPNAGEIAQGFAVGMRMGATKKDFDDTIGIHPTCSEIFTTMEITKKSNINPAQSGC